MHPSQNPPKIFYGWWIVVACFIISAYIGGVVLYGFTAIFEPVADEFGWSYAQISVAASIRGLETGLLAPLVGIMVDRWGPRRLMFAGGILIGLGLLLLSRTTSLGMFWGAFGLVAAGMSVATATVMMTAVTSWFREKVGLAAGIALSGFGFSGFLIPVVVRVIDSSDWRTAMVIFGIGMWALVLPLSLLLRRNPRQYGYLPYGETNDTTIIKNGAPPAQTVKADTGAKRALKSIAFRHIALAMMCQMMAVMAVITHIMPYLSSIGIARSTASLAVSAIPLASIGGRLGSGWLSDKFDSKRVATLGFALLSLGLLLASSVSAVGLWLLIPFSIIFGVGYGALTTSRVALLTSYFGRSRFGTIHGFTVGILMIGTVVGPLLAGWVFDNYGSYDGIWLAFAGLIVVALIIMATTPSIDATVRLADRN